MNTLKKTNKHRATGAHWAWLLPILALSPLALAAKGCDSAVVGDDCPNAADCTPGSAGKTSDPAGETCGGLLGVACADGLYCAFADDAQCGAADQTGVCSKKPEACTEEYAPVCGCDGNTYGNACMAKAAGTSVSAKGECEGTGSGGSTGSGGATQGGSTGSGGATQGGATCGGITAKQCSKGEYCNFPIETKCGSGDQTGTCAPITQGCPKNLAPVCGCDGNTYGNACMAAAAGVSVASNGECKVTGKACGTRGGVICADGEFCNYPPSSMCGRADGPGTCTKIPKGGACDAIYAPVCGCDGKTYGNDCEALNAGVSVDYEGACGATGGDCGGLLGKECKAGFYCDFPPDMICGNADGTGTCKAKPGACTEVFAPVCGCDGMTYGNECSANAAGVDIVGKGPCAK